MLVLSRKTGRRVCIGETVVITVLALDNGQVRLAFDAPPHVSIDRDEVRQRKSANAQTESIPKIKRIR